MSYKFVKRSVMMELDTSMSESGKFLYKEGSAKIAPPINSSIKQEVLIITFLLQWSQ